MLGNLLTMVQQEKWDREYGNNFGETYDRRYECVFDEEDCLFLSLFDHRSPSSMTTMKLDA